MEGQAALIYDPSFKKVNLSPLQHNLWANGYKVKKLYTNAYQGKFKDGNYE